MMTETESVIVFLDCFDGRVVFLNITSKEPVRKTFLGLPIKTSFYHKSIEVR